MNKPSSKQSANSEHLVSPSHAASFVSQPSFGSPFTSIQPGAH